MSDIAAEALKGAWDVVRPVLLEGVKTYGPETLSRLKGLVSGTAPLGSIARVEKLLTEAAEFRVQALAAPDATTKCDFEEAVNTSLRRAKTLALAEAVVGSDSAAAWLEAVGRQGLEILTVAGTVAVKIALRSLTGGIVG